MKRNSFIKAISAAGAFLSAPFTAIAQLSRDRPDKGITVKAGKDRYDKPISPKEGATTYTKVATKDTDGDFFMFESSRIKEGGPASFHLHYDQDEFWYIIKGEYLIKVGDETFAAKEGDTVFGPRKVPHTFSKVGEGEARILIFFQPAGRMEEMFKKLSEGVTEKMTEEEKDKFSHEHGIKRVGPGLKIPQK